MKSYLLCGLALSAVWVHTEMREITQNFVSGQTFYTISKRTGVLSPTASSSCGTKSSPCVYNMPSDIEVGGAGVNVASLVSLIAETDSPLDKNGSLQLAGNLLPTLNGNSHSAYFVQLVFSSPAKQCNNFGILAQVVMTPVYEKCTKFIEVDGKAYFTKTVFDNVNFTYPVAKDFYCVDSGCDTCIPGTYWELRTDCVLNSVSDQLSAAYYGYVGSDGMTISLNGSDLPSFTKTAPATTSKPEPTSFSSGTIASIFAPLWIFMF